MVSVQNNGLSSSAFALLLSSLEPTIRNGKKIRPPVPSTVPVTGTLLTVFVSASSSYPYGGTLMNTLAEAWNYGELREVLLTRPQDIAALSDVNSTEIFKVYPNQI